MTHPVLEVLHTRLRDDSAPGARSDPHRVAVVLEGGGMRGVVSGGMVTALEQLGLRGVFDLVVGSSAGALAGAYFLAGQAALGTSIYYEDLIGRHWINRRGVLRGRPLLRLEYLLDEVMAHRKPLDWDALLASGVALRPVVTRLPDYQPALLGTGGTREELCHALRASARIPLVAGDPDVVDRVEYIDGSFSEAIPIRTAQTLGATRFVVLLTRPEGCRRRDPGRLDRRALAPAMDWKLPGLGATYLRRAERYDRELALLEDCCRDTEAGPTALAIRPPAHAPEIRQLEQGRTALRTGAEIGEEAVLRALAPIPRRSPTAPRVPVTAGGR